MKPDLSKTKARLTGNDEQPAPTDPNELVLIPRWTGRNGTCNIVAKIGGEPVHAEKVDTARAASRKQFADELTEGRPGLDREAIEAELLRLAASRIARDDNGDDGAEDRSVAETLIDLARESSDLFHDAEPRAYATIKVDDHRETWPVRSRTFKLWLRRRLHENRELSASADAIRQAIENIESLAIFAGEERDVHVRIAEHDGAIYLDLADEQWRAAEVTRDGWRLVDDPAVRFIRPRGVLPLPVPTRGGSLEQLRSLLNVRAEADYVLIVAWLLAAFRPVGPYPVLNVVGDRLGSSSTADNFFNADSPTHQGQ